MTAYMPGDQVALGEVALILVMALLAGLALNRAPPRWYARVLAWLVTVGGTAGVERLCREEPAGVRMLAIIAALLFGMKAVVTVESRADGLPALPTWHWLGFAVLWPGMQPALFAKTDTARKTSRGGVRLILRGCLSACLGLAMVFSVWLITRRTRCLEEAGLPTCVLATGLVLAGISLMLHFGIFNVTAGLWRLAGVEARPLFRAPLMARSLGEFWGRRWNLAFSEMAALGIYRPLSGCLGARAATVTAFLASGLLHELAISLPVLAGFGLPMSYFLLHGTLVLTERRLERAGRAVSGWGWWAHLWVLGWLALPLPILFHPPFLRGVVWPLIGL